MRPNPEHRTAVAGSFVFPIARRPALIRLLSTQQQHFTNFTRFHNLPKRLELRRKAQGKQHRQLALGIVRGPLDPVEVDPRNRQRLLGNTMNAAPQRLEDRTGAGTVVVNDCHDIRLDLIQHLTLVEESPGSLVLYFLCK